MKKTWFTNLLMITLVTLSLGFLDVSSAFGYIYNNHNNYISNTGGWPVYDAYVNENLRAINDFTKKNIDSDNSYSNHKKISFKQNSVSDAYKELNNNMNNDEKNYDEHKIENINKIYQTAINEMIINSNKTENNKLESQIKRLEDKFEEATNSYDVFSIFCFIMIIISIVVLALKVNILLKSNKKDDSQSYLKPDISELENLITQSNSLKHDFKNIQHESDLTIFTKLDLLKDDFYNELNKVDWKQNKNKLLVEKYQLLVSHYVKEMTTELNKIHDKFNQLVTANINQTIDKIKIIQQS